MGKVYTHFQTERVQKPCPLWWLRAAWGGSTSGGAAFLEGCFECVRPKGGLQWFCLYLIFMYINNIWCLQPCINKGDDNDNGFWYSDQGHSSLPHPLPQLRWAHQCLTCMLVPFLVVRLKKKTWNLCQLQMFSYLTNLFSSVSTASQMTIC